MSQPISVQDRTSLLRKLTVISAFVDVFPKKVDYHSYALPLYPIKLHQIFHPLEEAFSAKLDSMQLPHPPTPLQRRGE